MQFCDPKLLSFPTFRSAALDKPGDQFDPEIVLRSGMRSVHGVGASPWYLLMRVFYDFFIVGRHQGMLRRKNSAAVPNHKQINCRLTAFEGFGHHAAHVPIVPHPNTENIVPSGPITQTQSVRTQELTHESHLSAFA